MKSKKAAVIITVALLGVILASWAVRLYWAQAGSMSTEAQVEHAGDRQGGSEEHGEEKVVKLSDDEMKEFGIEVGTAGPGKLQIFVSLPGEIVANADRLAHVVPRVPGVVREVRKTLGDRVRAREAMAVLESSELADAKAAFLAARERVELAKANFAREEGLWKKRISSEQEYLEAKQALSETLIEQRSAEQKLHALGFSDEYLAQMPKHPDVSFTRYEILAPFDGVVIEKHISLGEVLKDDERAFIIADLSNVWVDLRVYQKDLPYVREGQPVIISAGRGIPDARGTISYLSPVVGEETRTALARVVLPNTDGLWRPGLFITGKIVVKNLAVPLLVPKTALQTVEGETSIFVKTADGFEPKPVILGRVNETHVEIASGITPGQRYVTRGAFVLKAQLSKEAFGGGHGH